jgi:hypothetical protein
MRRFLVLSPFALALAGCIDSAVDLSASIPTAFPLAEGFYEATNDPKAPAFKIVKSGSDYRAIDPGKTDGSGAEAGAPHYLYYFVRVDSPSGTVDLYDLTKADWRRLPANPKKRLDPNLHVADDETASVLREIDRWIARRPIASRTRFRLVKPVAEHGALDDSQVSGDFSPIGDIMEKTAP